MSGNTPSKDLRTIGYVIKRVNFGEADRILTLLTPEGKISVMAKGARKPRSKLAGGIEMFTLSDFVIHLGRGDFGILTSSKMRMYYSEIPKDFKKMELAAEVIKKINRLAENDATYFEILDLVLSNLNKTADIRVIRLWFLLQIKKTMGEEMNLYRNRVGAKLKPKTCYAWDELDAVFYEEKNGIYGENEIKMLRVLSANDLNFALRVKIDEATLNRVLNLVEIWYN